jgi:hypothetical protein
LGHASRLLAAYVTPGGAVDEDLLTNATIRIARKFEAYACGDLDMAEAKTKMAKKAVEEELGE